MGGGSLQIAFATDGNTEGIDPSNLAKFNLGSHGNELEYSLFVTTHLGFGANVALSKHINSIKENSPSNSAQGKNNDEFFWMRLNLFSEAPTLPK